MFEQIKEQDETYILHSYGRVAVALESGSGVHAVDTAGKTYVDFTSGIGVNSLGYCHPKWVQAVIAQAGKIQHMSNYYYSPIAIELAAKLTKAAGLSRVFFCNSGAEANECAIKIARKAGIKKGATIVTLKNSFHGRTLTTLAATGQESFHRDFLPLTPGFVSCQAGDIDALKNAIDSTVCAVLLECVQGEGGVLPMSEDYLRAVRALCDERDILLLVDEVQTGVGRTGYFYAYQSAGITPDVVTSAKGLAGGLPIGACLVSEKWKDIFAPGNNGSTFGGNPVVCAGAIAVIDEINTPEFLESVLEKGAYFKAELEKISGVKFVRGKGLMLGVALKDKDAHQVLTTCAQAGLLVLTAKELIRFLPPLNITKEEIDEGLKIFAACV
ncbi:MAG: aspartate aminotransferase family protein [Oscillospiraceae bacterium]